MLFKNAHVYRITSEPPTAKRLEKALDNERFTPCTGLRPSSFGWISPLGDDGALTHEVAGSILLCARREDKVVPPSALNEALAEKVRKLESLDGQPVRQRDRMRLKDDALAELLPRALARSKQVQGYITPKDNLLVIDTSSTPEAEIFINSLRAALGSFAVVPPEVKGKPTDVFTHWLNTRRLPKDLRLGDACDLLDPEEGSTVTCRKQDLESREVRTHLEAGKICTRVGLRWHDDLKLTVDRELVLRQLKMESGDGDEENADDDPVARLDAAFADMTLTLAGFLQALLSALGGETRR